MSHARKSLLFGKLSVRLTCVAIVIASTPLVFAGCSVKQQIWEQGKALIVLSVVYPNGQHGTVFADEVVKGMTLMRCKQYLSSNYEAVRLKLTSLPHLKGGVIESMECNWSIDPPEAAN